MSKALKSFSCTGCNSQIRGTSMTELLRNIEQHCSTPCGSTTSLLQDFSKLSLQTGSSTSTAPKQVKLHTCLICAEEHPLDNIVHTNCPSDHSLCTQCLKRYVTSCIKEESAINCPFRKCTPKSTPDNPHQLFLLSDETLLIYCKECFSKAQWQKYLDFLALLSASLDPCFCRCPNNSCRYGEIARSVPSETNYDRISCGKCKTNFCSFCNEAYHYKVNCRTAVELRQRWNEYKLVGRATTARQLATNRQEWETRMQTLKLDEEQKARECRRCPHCNRVVYKIEGCDSMLCGSDYHGGNIQAGCQKNFRWTSAKPYVPDIAPPCPPPARSTNVVHGGYHCSACAKEIVGIRFSCIHCVGVDFCEQCEEVNTAAHPTTHVFRMITAPTDL